MKHHYFVTVTVKTNVLITSPDGYTPTVTDIRREVLRNIDAGAVTNVLDDLVITRESHDAS